MTTPREEGIDRFNFYFIKIQLIVGCFQLQEQRGIFLESSAGICLLKCNTKYFSYKVKQAFSKYFVKIIKIQNNFFLYAYIRFSLRIWIRFCSFLYLTSNVNIRWLTLLIIPETWLFVEMCICCYTIYSVYVI